MNVVVNATIDLRRQIRAAFQDVRPAPHHAALVEASYRLAVLSRVAILLREREPGLRFRLVQPEGSHEVLRLRAAPGPADRCRLSYVEVTNAQGRIIGEMWLNLTLPATTAGGLPDGCDVVVVDAASWGSIDLTSSRLLLRAEACCFPYGPLSLQRSVRAHRHSGAEPPYLVYGLHPAIEDLMDDGDRLGVYINHLPL
jgi:hypothetical protein